jgi:UDP-2,3-diacylglucosamine hydrolase
VAHYFASDVHLRFDRPDRDRRFSQWLTCLTPADALLLAGDLCDFWMAARCVTRDLMRSESLLRLAEFRRRGGSLSIMPGNHDAWLCPFYASELGAQIVPDPCEITVHGLRLHIVHGHLLGARRAWKALMESRSFFRGFGRLPALLARPLDGMLAWNNDRKLISDEERHLEVYRGYASKLRGAVDLVIIGHVHRAVDDCQNEPRMIVLGGWQARSSFLKVDERGATFHLVDDRDPHSPPNMLSPTASASPQGQVSFHED